MEGEYEEWNEHCNDGIELNVMGRAQWQEQRPTVGTSGNRWRHITTGHVHAEGKQQHQADLKV